MERKGSNQMFVISNIKQWVKEMRVCHALSLFAIEKKLEMCPWDTDAPAIAKFA